MGTGPFRHLPQPLQQLWVEGITVSFVHMKRQQSLREGVLGQCKLFHHHGGSPARGKGPFWTIIIQEVDLL